MTEVKKSGVSLVNFYLRQTIDNKVSELKSVINKGVSFNTSPTLNAKIVGFTDLDMDIDGTPVVPMCIMEVVASEYGLRPENIGNQFKADLTSTWNSYFH